MLALCASAEREPGNRAHTVIPWPHTIFQHAEALFVRVDYRDWYTGSSAIRHPTTVLIKGELLINILIIRVRLWVDSVNNRLLLHSERIELIWDRISEIQEQPHVLSSVYAGSSKLRS